MIEIKSRWDGKVLYAAKDALDVRQAVVQAAKEGADLRGADLGGADLGGADLRGADLRGAKGLPPADKIAALLEEARKLMNQRGKHWVKGHEHKILDNGEDAYCSIGAIKKAGGPNSPETGVALAILQSAIESDIAAWNDATNRKWGEVSKGFRDAGKLAKKVLA